MNKYSFLKNNNSYDLKYLTQKNISGQFIFGIYNLLSEPNKMNDSDQTSKPGAYPFGKHVLLWFEPRSGLANGIKCNLDE